MHGYSSSYQLTQTHDAKFALRSTSLGFAAIGLATWSVACTPTDFLVSTEYQPGTMDVPAAS